LRSTLLRGKRHLLRRKGLTKREWIRWLTKC
jgi:hypothetical protein